VARAPWRHFAIRYGYVRSSALLLALFALIGVGQVLPALHFTLVAHRVCAEHGEAVHAPDAAGGDFAALTGEDAEVTGEDAEVTGEDAEVLLTPTPAQSEHEHEHCTVLGVGRASDAMLRAASSRVELPVSAEHLDVAVERAAHVDIALLLYAPKLAPPV
jgi:hypothetical protein